MSAPLRRTTPQAVGRVFTATRDGHTYRVKLTHIQDLVPTTAKQRPHCFGADVRAGRQGTAAGRDVRVEAQAGCATHKLFISAVGTEGDMQAIINRSH